LARDRETSQSQAVVDQRFKVLLVEDNPGDARLIQESLADTAGDPFDVETADRLTTALRRLGDGGIDAVLLDLALPDSKGQETFDKAKAQAPTVPIIVLTGLGDESMALKMVKEGAQDYLAKIDLNGSLLSRAIRYAIERERGDQQIRRFNEDLEHRVRMRTAELEEANKELESFSYSVSHDLRAPLRHIDGFARILLEAHASQLDSDGQKYLERIVTAAQNMGAIIDDLLKLAQVGRTQLNIETVSLGALVEQVRLESLVGAEERNIEWKIATLPCLSCDAGLIKQVFANLIGNSVKYTRPRQTAVIEIGQTVSNGTPAFFIRDNGAGFDMKYAGKLFGTFQRLHQARDFEGTGIGLATVQRIVQRHGGRIWAESEVDRGATFYFTLESVADVYFIRRPGGVESARP
jgi:two-component system, sensor histidine kinase and response regulator